MKQERFTAVWGWLAIAQIVLFVVCFPHVLGMYRSSSAEVVGVIIGNDFLSIGCWLGILWLYEQKDNAKGIAKKLLLVLAFILCAFPVLAVLLINVLALFA